MQEIKVREYLEAITGDREVLRLEGTASVDVPRYLSGLYDLRDVALLNIPVVVAILRPVTLPSVIDIERHYEILKTRSQKEVMFVFDSISARTAERLISRRIPHIVVGKQVFLPFLLVDIKSAGHLRNRVSLPNTTKLGPWTESLIIRQLLDRDLEGTTGTEIARKMNTSVMTAQRAVSQLKAANLCRFEEQGKKHILRFDDQDSLWEKSSKILLPPLSMTLALSDVPKGLQTFVSGVSALAKSTLLAEDEIPVLATSRRNYARVEKKVTVPIEDAKFLLEVWDRDPALTAKDRVVDPISLYLNMRHGDDRVRIALADLLRSFGLGELS